MRPIDNVMHQSMQTRKTKPVRPASSSYIEIILDFAWDPIMETGGRREISTCWFVLGFKGRKNSIRCAGISIVKQVSTAKAEQRSVIMVAYCRRMPRLSSGHRGKNREPPERIRCSQHDAQSS